MAAAPQTDANAAPGQETAPARNADVARALRWYVLACAGASAAIGAAGLLAWHARLPLLLTWWVGGTALHYNTAVLLVLASASLVASVQQRRVLCGGLGLVVAVAAALILVNELLWLHWGLNELLFRVSAGPVRVASTRVAPNTAVALFAAGLAMLWTIAPRVLRWRGVAIAGLGSLVAIVATVSLVGYAFSIHAAYRWRAYNAMSLPAAVAIAFLGLALVLTGRLQAERDA